MNTLQQSLYLLPVAMLVACSGSPGGSAPADSVATAADPGSPPINMTAPAPSPAAASFQGRQYTCGAGSTGNPSIGCFSAPVAEPDIVLQDPANPKMAEVVATKQKCIPAADGTPRCKPAAVSIALLPDNRLVYFNGLENTEDVDLSIIDEFGYVSIDDQTRNLSLGPAGPKDTFSWMRPSPLRAGSNIDGYPSHTLLPGGVLTDANAQHNNDGALFCSSLVQLYDGRILDSGGTDYYTEPSLRSLGGPFPSALDAIHDGLNGPTQKISGDLLKLAGFASAKGFGVPKDIGVVELEGIKNSRIFDWRTDGWTQSGNMHFGRWYPTMVNLANSNVLVVGGVTKLLKPVYTGFTSTESFQQALKSPINFKDMLQSGDNVRTPEVYNVDKGTWAVEGTVNPSTGASTADKSLPLFARISLLTNGDVFYDAGGQAFNPFGQSYNQALWNFVSVFNPAQPNDGWTDLGYAGLPVQLNQIGLGKLASDLTATNPDLVKDLGTTLTGLLGSLSGEKVTSADGLASQLTTLLKTSVSPSVVNEALGSGFRGSTFSIMLPLKPDANGKYTQVNYLVAGGVLGAVVASSPGTYFGTRFSRIDTVNIGLNGNGNPSSSPNAITYTSAPTADMQPSPSPLNPLQGRWFPSGVLLPDESVMAFNGADRDAVVLPGNDIPEKTAQRYDPATRTWSNMAMSHHGRTYHNTAILLPDGRVLIGGHAPISSDYLYDLDLSSNPLGLHFSKQGRDPSFEVYSPPYMFDPHRPVITSAPTQLHHGDAFTVGTPQAGSVKKVLLVRRTAVTHLIDADQRTVELPFSVDSKGELSVTLPVNPALTPAGYYMLFIDTASDGSTPGELALVPSVSKEIHVLRDATPSLTAGV
ncbi:MAG TPA: galactose oxidase early set domain-containing protein [Nevskiaceae bacterium]|nr:galactose oxidase early set domain-containing protein [Nevskiaceae bacterium]